jgi:hypothetical protein
MAAPDKRAIAKARHQVVMGQMAERVFGGPPVRWRGAIDVAIDETLETTEERNALRTARGREIPRAQRALSEKKTRLREQASRPALTREAWLEKANAHIRSMSDSELISFDASPKFQALHPANKRAIARMLDEEGNRRLAESYGVEYVPEDAEELVLPAPDRAPTGEDELLPGPAPADWLEPEEEEIVEEAGLPFGTDEPFGTYIYEGPYPPMSESEALTGIPLAEREHEPSLSEEVGWEEGEEE